VELSGRGRPRSVDVRKFLSAPSSERIRPGEIVTAVTVAPAAPGTGSAYEKARDPASGYAICGVAAAVVLRADGKIKAAHLGIAGAGPVAVGAPEAEAALRGKREAAAGVITLAFPSDLAASAEYRAHLAQVLTVRAVRRAVQRATEAMA
jgi:carbon-monoxide dehydrogenase medium subunit